MAPPGQYKVGIGLDGRHHAVVRKWLLGRNALCGAGRIVVPVEGYFDANGLISCRHCVTRIRRPF